ncbi:32173_t:CDS:2, partial [Racocetra persica]
KIVEKVYQGSVVSISEKSSTYQRKVMLRKEGRIVFGKNGAAKDDVEI